MITLFSYTLLLRFFYLALLLAFYKHSLYLYLSNFFLLRFAQCVAKVPERSNDRGTKLCALLLGNNPILPCIQVIHYIHRHEIENLRAYVKLKVI